MSDLLRTTSEERARWLSYPIDKGATWLSEVHRLCRQVDALEADAERLRAWARLKDQECAEYERICDRKDDEIAALTNGAPQ